MFKKLSETERLVILCTIMIMCIIGFVCGWVLLFKLAHWGLALDRTPQAYGTTKTYTVEIYSYKGGAGGNADAIVSHVYITK